MITVYHNGDILTMEGDTPQYAECLITQDNAILHVGKMEDAKFWLSQPKDLVDLDGRCLMPGFIDPHIHPSMAGKCVALYPSIHCHLRLDSDHGLDNAI